MAWVALAWVASAARAGAAIDPATLVVKTPRGAVRGMELNGTWVFRGVPFAKPPVGELRFAPPVRPDPWEGVLDTTEFRDSCLQMGSPQVGGRWSEAAWNTLNITSSSEDCLYLNVYVPQRRNPNVTSPLLPVLAYLHAGEFRFGAANDQENNFPYNFDQAAILVTGSARLSLMGYAALDALRARDPAGSTGNYGVQDQRMMLQWIQESIMYFGGDPDRVTIFGESSGGASVGFHVTSNLSKGLFARAILESPGLTQSKPWVHSESNTQFAVSALTGAGSPGCAWRANASVYRSFAGVVVSHSRYTSDPNPFLIGTAPSADAGTRACDALPQCFVVQVEVNGSAVLYGGGRPGTFSESSLMIYNESNHAPPGEPVPTLLLRLGDPAAAVDCLVKANGSDLISINMAPPYSDTFFTDAEAPTVDGVELSDDLQVVVRTSVPAGLELLGGSNLDEGTEFMSSTPRIRCNASVGDLLAWATELFGPGLGAQVPSLYSSVIEPTPDCPYAKPGAPAPHYMAAMRSAGDNAITCRTRDMLRAASRSGGAGFWYLFLARPIVSVNMANLPVMGSFHGAEVPFVFGYPPELSSDGERALSRAMGCYWVNFASTGDPNAGPASCAGLPKWPEVSTMEGAVAIQFDNTSVSVVESLKQKQCDAFAKFP